MGVKAKTVGILFGLIGIVLIANAFQDQITAELVQQGIGLPDFLVDPFVPSPSENQLMQAGLGLVLMFVGIILFSK